MLFPFPVCINKQILQLEGAKGERIMNPEKKKVMALAVLSLSGSLLFFSLFYSSPRFPEAAFLLIILSLFLIFGSLPYMADPNREKTYRLRLTGTALLQVISCLLLLYG